MAAKQDFLKKRSDIFSADRQAMRDYLKEYGSFNQQKLAIAEEYAEKIKKATSEGERQKLIAERNTAQVRLTLMPSNKVLIGAVHLASSEQSLSLNLTRCSVSCER